jgi:hypothetical protein
MSVARLTHFLREAYFRAVGVHLQVVCHYFPAARSAQVVEDTGKLVSSHYAFLIIAKLRLPTPFRTGGCQGAAIAAWSSSGGASPNL